MDSCTTYLKKSPSVYKRLKSQYVTENMVTVYMHRPGMHLTIFLAAFFLFKSALAISKFTFEAELDNITVLLIWLNN